MDDSAPRLKTCAKSVRDAAYDAAHREERRAYAAAHREETQARQAAYRAAHLEQRCAHQRNRHARKRAAPGTHTAADVRAQYKRQKGRCFYGRKVNPDCAVSLKAGYHVDHVTPLVKKGSNGTENTVLTCPSCNLRKGAKHPMDFAGRML